MSDVILKYIPQRNVIQYIGKYFNDVRHHFSVVNKHAAFVRRRGGFIPDRTYAITPTGTFQVGLLKDVLQFVKSKSDDVEIEIDKEIPAIARPVLSDLEPFDNLSLKLREYQTEAVRNALRKGRGVIKLGTGGGKTLVMASLISTVYDTKNNIRVLVIVPDLGLVSQTIRDFREYEVPFTYSGYTGNLPLRKECNVIVANMGILQSRKEELIESGFLSDINLLIVDEVHKVKKGNEIVKLIDKVQTHNRIGLTGTLPEQKIDEWNVIGRFGPVIFEKTSAELRDENYLANVSAVIVEATYKTSPPKPDPNSNEYQAELEFIKNNQFRNSLIKSICNLSEQNTLILVNRIEHGQILTDYLKNNTNKEVVFIRGDVDVDDRMKAIAMMEMRPGVICVAISAIFSTGVNIKNLHNIIFAAGGKSMVQVVQSIGRGLRLHKSKSKLTIYDIADDLAYGAEHAKQRSKIYDTEQIKYKILSVVES